MSIWGADDPDCDFGGYRSWPDVRAALTQDWKKLCGTQREMTSDEMDYIQEVCVRQFQLAGQISLFEFQRIWTGFLLPTISVIKALKDLWWTKNSADIVGAAQ